MTANQTMVEHHDRGCRVVLGVLIAAGSLGLAILSVLRHRAFYSLEDVGEFTQMLWATLQGRLFYTNLAGIGPLAWVPHNYLGEHFSPILFLLIPPFAVHPEPETLLVIQAVLLGLAALPLYLIVQQRCGVPILSMAFALAWLISPYVWQSNISDFHLDTFEPVLIFSAFYFAGRKRLLLYTTFVLLLLACKEDTFFYVIAMGTFLTITRREVRLGLCTAAGGVVWGLLTFSLFMPFFRADLGEQYPYLVHYAHLGRSFPDILGTLLLEPGRVASHLLQRAIVVTTLTLLGSVAFLPVLSAGGLVLLAPATLEKLLANSTEINTLSWYYAASVVPFVFVAAIAGAERLARVLPSDHSRRRGLRVIAGLIVAASALAANSLDFGLFGGLRVTLPAPALSRDGVLWVSRRDVEVRRFLESIPAKSSIGTTSFLVSHVAKRFEVSVYPHRPLEGEIILVDLFGETYPADLERYKRKLLKLLAGGEYGVVDFVRGLLYLKRGHDPSRNVTIARRIVGLFEAEELDARGPAWHVADLGADNKRAVEVRPGRGGGGTTVIGPRVLVPHGRQAVSVRMKIRSRSAAPVAKLEIVADRGPAGRTREILLERVIEGLEFDQAGVFQVFVVRFESTGKRAGVQTLIHLYAGVAIRIDRIQFLAEEADVEDLKGFLSQR